MASAAGTDDVYDGLIDGFNEAIYGTPSACSEAISRSMPPGTRECGQQSPAAASGRCGRRQARGAHPGVSRHAAASDRRAASNLRRVPGQHHRIEPEGEARVSLIAKHTTSRFLASTDGDAVLIGRPLRVMGVNLGDRLTLVAATSTNSNRQRTRDG